MDSQILYTLVVAVLATAAIAGLKELQVRLPKNIVPIAAPVIGGAIEGLARWATLVPDGVPVGAGALAGLAGTGIREVYDQNLRGARGRKVAVFALAGGLAGAILAGCAFQIPLKTERVTQQLDAAGNVVAETSEKLAIEGWLFQHRPSDVTQMDTLNGLNIGFNGSGIQIGSASRASYPGYDTGTVFPDARLNANAGGVFDYGQQGDVANTIEFGTGVGVTAGIQRDALPAPEEGDDGGTVEFLPLE